MFVAWCYYLLHAIIAIMFISSIVKYQTKDSLYLWFRYLKKNWSLGLVITFKTLLYIHFNIRPFGSFTRYLRFLSWISFSSLEDHIGDSLLFFLVTCRRSRAWMIVLNNIKQYYFEYMVMIEQIPAACSARL